LRDGRGSCLDSRRLGSITCRPGSGTVSPSPSSGYGPSRDYEPEPAGEAGERPKRHLRATTSHIRSTQMAGVVFPGEQVPPDAAGHFEILFATGQIVFGGTPVLAVAVLVCLLPVVAAASVGAAVRAGRWRWPPAPHGGRHRRRPGAAPPSVTSVRRGPLSRSRSRGPRSSVLLRSTCTCTA
jgi:hypothetical protein